MRLLSILIKTIIILFVSFNVFILAVYYTGFEPTIITTGSMRPTLPVGTICFVDKSYLYEDLVVNDIISYEVPGQKVIHRIVETRKNGYKTKGDANEKMDTALITEDMYYGKVAFYLPYLGYLAMTFQSTLGRIVLVSILALLVIVNFILNKKIKF